MINSLTSYNYATLTKKLELLEKSPDRPKVAIIGHEPCLCLSTWHEFDSKINSFHSQVMTSYKVTDKVDVLGGMVELGRQIGKLTDIEGYHKY